MNRLVSAHGPLVVTVATVWLLTALDVSAQIQMLGDEASSPSSAVPSSAAPAGAPPTLASAQKSLAEVRAAMGRKDYHTAVQSFRRASTVRAQFPQISGEVERLRTELEGIGIDGALLAMPPQPVTRPTMQRLPDVADAQPISSATRNPAERKQEALRLVAIGRAALDRGDAATALAVARQAESLKVPEKDFAAGEPRVWQLLLDAESAARKSGIALAGSTSR